MTQQEILYKLKTDQPALRRYGVKSLSLFGSVARKENQKASDIDLLVEFQEPIGLFEFVDLKEHLENILGTPVDLVTEEALHPRLKSNILRESIHVL